MLDFDQTRTWAALEAMLPTGSSRRDAMLGTVIAHMKAEVRRDIDGLMATLVPAPQYHFWSGTSEHGPKGWAAVRDFYEDFARSGGAILQSPKDRIVLDDRSIAMEGTSTTIARGDLALRRGFDVPTVDGYYAIRTRQVVFWSFDDAALAYGEDSYTVVNPQDFDHIAVRDLPQAYVEYMAELGEPVSI
jgi:hypothetical protein